MLENYLVLKFKNEEGKRFSMTIKDIDTTLEEAGILALVKEILDSNVLMVGGYHVTECYSAEMVAKETTEIDLA